ncbi:hypothetical protein F2Q68_00034697 [Brassica cretica]|uniref:ABC-2 type transporter transmembrane domain-containing protein n=1 Tax=Brassica cretica TaxID=69181 RepID=A0A8S9H386_BRACR|nr:hypothetical protein F2Q68_00034697 [Brassica cretica]
MADSDPASFLTQANAILRKNLTYQKRNVWSNVRLIMIPFYLCLVLVGIQALFDSQVSNSLDNQCGCKCIHKTGDETCQMVCGVEYSTRDQAVFCAIPNPQPWPPLILIPLPRNRVVDANLTNVSCKQRNNCPVTILFTGNNQSLGATLSRNLFRRSFPMNYSDLLFSLADNVLATTYKGSPTNYLDAGIVSDRFIYNIQSRCTPNSKVSFSLGQSPLNFTKEMRCVQGLNLWINSSREINDDIFKGYLKGNSEGMINEIVAAYDLLDTNRTNFNVNIWYNATYQDDSGNMPPKLLRVPRLVSLMSNAYLQYLKSPRTRMLLEFVKEMPKPETKLRLDIASLIGAVFFTWVILLLFPVILTSLVYEKQQRLRIIMKMHGLGDGPYWMITYTYFLAISTSYVICLMIFGSAIGLNFFRLNDYSIHFVFYFLYINLQISLAFLASSAFSNVETASGLDPASRMNLWTVIKRAKTNTAIILTTHSMEEAEFLCDRLGIFVDGRLQCIGNPKELKGRYGGSYVLTMTTASEHEKDVEVLVQDVSPNAKKIYNIAGTQKFEIPKEEVRISEVFQAVEKAKSTLKVFAWGLADTTLEDVFIKVARSGQAFNVFS